MKNLIATAATGLLLGTLTAWGTDGIEMRHQGPNNTLVRVTAPARYILLPVQESAPNAEIRILSDGKFDRQINVNLANTRVDYYVPLDITPYEGEHLLIDVRTHYDRTTGRESSDAVWNELIKLSDSFNRENTEKFRPKFHHSPDYGWMNDPNGMFYKDGTWHLYYQYNPYGSKWQNMSWGHATSTDLVNWEMQPVVLEPGSIGAIFSGSSVIDKDNTAGFGNDAVIALYTSADAIQTQSLAYSLDNGQTFTNYYGNPVLVYKRESRDPNMFWDAKRQCWVLLLASALDGEMLIYNSKDLKEFDLTGSFGKDYGCRDGVWECPDLLQLPVDGTDEKKWVLICNINPGGPFGGSATQYFVGDFDGKTFKSDSPAETVKWMDYGKDHYATVSWHNAPDNRHTVIGWMSNWEYANDVPTKQFRSSNTLPRDLSLFRAPDGELYVASRPSPELEAMRLPARKQSATINAKGKSYQLPADRDGICEIAATLTIPKGATTDLTLSNAAGEKVVMTIDPAADSFSMDRTKSGITDFSEHFPAVTVAPARNGSNTYEVRIFVDRSSIEAFAADGRFAMTNLVFPENPYTTLSVSSHGGKTRLESLYIYPLDPAKGK